MNAPQDRRSDPLTVLLLGWLVPGLGHALIGRKGKGAFFLAAIVGTLLAGMMIGRGRCLNLSAGYLILAAQMLAGLPALIMAGASTLAGIDYPVSHVIPLFDVGSLYTCMAGLMNLMVAIDAALKATETHPRPRDVQETA